MYAIIFNSESATGLLKPSGLKRGILSDTITRMVVLSEGSDIAPGSLLTYVQSLGEPVEVKETCYGLMVQGDRQTVDKVINALKERAPYSVFTKERAFCIGEKRKCRIGKSKGISGAARPGFHQLKIEAQLLDDLGKALKAVDVGENEVTEKESFRLNDEDLEAMVVQILSKEKVVDH